MNKFEYLDMLKDYLLKAYSEEESLEIIRDYEEYFLNGKLDGKTDEELILELGSPKKILEELSNIDTSKNRDKNHKFFYKIKEKVDNFVDNFIEKNILTRSNNKINSLKIYLAVIGFMVLFLLGLGTNKLATFTSVLIGSIFFIKFRSYFILGALTSILLIFLCVALLLWLALVFITILGVLVAILLTPYTINGLAFLSMNVLWIIFPILLAFGLFIMMSIIIKYYSLFLYKSILYYVNWIKIKLIYLRKYTSFNRRNFNNGQEENDER